jgi:DNA polymerase V
MALRFLAARTMPQHLARTPLLLARVPAGFPSPADDYIERSLNLHEMVVRHPASTFFVRVAGDSMEPSILAGDLLVVDRSLTSSTMAVVLAVVEGEFTVKRLSTERGQAVLLADNPAYAPIRQPFEVWGVVTYVVRARP